MPLMNPHDVIAAANARSNKIVQTAHIRAIKEDGARTKAVAAAFQTYLAKAPLAERRAFVEALGIFAKGIAAERIAAFAEALVEWVAPEPAKVEAAGSEVPQVTAVPAVSTVKVERPVAKGDGHSPTN